MCCCYINRLLRCPVLLIHNSIIPEQARVITQVVILDADKKQIQCVVRPLQILRADGKWENIGGMK
ncbi:phage tail fiber C-terminal domain-containing protein [Escherichia albertii]|uniref:phage tail fiber C-terminal domain-containing protein n=1 Tax=Escherichia albertii TaxID=208962 RepID=UPI000743E4A0|nr:phage tail fiber C-terminal domain-containing protein [Escherichia albertii]WDC08810.1 phage tail fiber C-terminal domain-containing protein [Escherichia albertii]